VREAGLAHSPGDPVEHRLVRLRRELVGVSVGHHPGDLEQLEAGVVGKVDVMSDARRHPGVEPEEAVHAVPIAGQDDDEPLAVVLHHLEEDLDRLDAVVALVVGAVEVISLIDEQYAAEGPFENFLRLRRGMADVLPDEVIARNRDHVVALDVAEPVEDLGDPHRHRCLPGARVAGEAHVQGRARGGETGVPPQPLDDEQCGDLPDPPLDWCQRHEVAVEVGEHTLDIGLAQDGRGIEGARRWLGEHGHGRPPLVGA
jgi:hypothetical protein